MEKTQTAPKLLNSTECVRYLVTEYYPQEVPLRIRVATAFELLEEAFGNPIDIFEPLQSIDGGIAEVTEEALIEWVSDLAFRSLGEGCWALVDIRDGEVCYLAEPVEASWVTD